MSIPGGFYPPFHSKQQQSTMAHHFKYSLGTYREVGKVKCPFCGKREFVRLIETDTRRILDGYGRCDRDTCPSRGQSSSGVVYPGKDIDTSKFAVIEQKTVDPVYYDRQTVSNYTLYKYNNGLSRFLQPKFKKSVLTKVFKDYCIGSIDGGIIFWQVDEQYRIHRGKIMWYNPDGHRTKIQNPDGSQRGKIKMMWQYLRRDRDVEPEMCYFGQHLISLYPDKPVALVESEKTAIIASLVMPDFNWIATLSINNFQSHRLGFLKGFGNYVIVFPDRDGFNMWKDKTAAIQELMPDLKIGINDFILQYGSGKEDLADVFLKYV